jgi:ribose transport system ATP-binding protein
LDNFSFGPVLKLKKEKDVSKDFMVKFSIIPPIVERRVKFLSGGNQQKVVLAKWLCSKAKIFIFDEPTTGIDVGAKTEIYKLINLLAKEKAGVIMISSYLPEILAICDRIIVLNKGKITKELKREEATQENILYYSTI